MSSSGPNYAATCANAGLGGLSWTNPGNATANDGTTASVTFNGSTADSLQWTDFGFSIPSGVTIDGIVFEVYRSGNSSNTGDANVYLVKSGSAVGTNKANGASLNGPLTIATYGGSTDLWGATWTYSDINASNFGVQWGAGGQSGRSATVDYGRLTVYYTTSSGVTVSVSALVGSGTLSTATVGYGVTASASPVSGSGTLSSATTDYDFSLSASSLSGSGTLPAPAIHFDRSFTVSSLVGSGVLPSASVVAGGSVSFSASALFGDGQIPDPQAGGFVVDPVYLAGAGTLSDGFVVVADCSISVSPISGAGTLPDNGLTVDPLAGEGTIGNVNVLVPPSLYVLPLPLSATGVISGVSVGRGWTLAASSLAGSGAIGSVTVVTNGNVAILPDALGTLGVISPVNVWLNATSTLVYSIYANDGAGGAIDYDTPIAATQSLSWQSDTLDFPGEWKFGVRVSDLASGLEEKNVDAAIRLILDSTGADITNRPLPPIGLRVLPTAGGNCRVEWAYPYTDRARRQTGFRVYSGPLGSVDYGTVKATKPGASPGNYAVDLSGFSDGVSYSVGVRAFNATSEEPNTNTTSFTADATGPTAVQSLAATSF